MIDGQRLSIATGSLNRLEHLKQSLSTWLIAPEPDEIVVVDWGNEIPLQESLREFNDSRIVIARAEGQRHWQMSKVNNLELLLASATIFDGVAQKVAAPLPAAKATVLLSPSTRTRARAIKA